MRILHYGFSGFIGSHFSKYAVDRGHQITKISKFANLRNREFDIGNSEQAIFFSSAWISNRTPDYLYSNSNYDVMLKHCEIAEFCSSRDIPLLVLGSCLEYLENRKIPYIDSKILLLERLRNQLDKDLLIWARLFYIFSVNDQRPRVIKDYFDAVEKNKKFFVKNPQGIHDYIDVRDACLQLLYLIENLKFGVWDIGTGVLRSTLRLLSALNVKNQLEFELNQIKENDILWSMAARRLIPEIGRFTYNTTEYFGEF